ncbi:MAG TPA: hypothetical protein ACYCDB_01415 [Candidatus Azoamicus sp.]
MYRFGKYDFVKNWTIKKVKNEKHFPLILVDKNDVLAYFKLENPIRKNTKILIYNMKKLNLNLHILSGDPSDDVEKISKDLQIINKNTNISVKGKVTYIKKFDTKITK